MITRDEEYKKIGWCALLIIIATITSSFPILVLEDGGSWTFFSLLPLWLITYFFGFKTGLIWSFIFSFFKMFATFFSEMPANFAELSRSHEYDFFKNLLYPDMTITLTDSITIPVNTRVCVFMLEYIFACSFFCIGGLLKSNRECTLYINSVKDKRIQKMNTNYQKYRITSKDLDGNVSKEALNNCIEYYYPALPTKVIVDEQKENSSTGLVWGYICGVFCMFIFYLASSYLFYMEENLAGPFPFNFDRLIYDIKYDGSYLLIEAITTIILLEIPGVQKIIFRIKHLANNPKDDLSVHNF